MRAALYQQFRAPLVVVQVDDPAPAKDGTVLKVAATGVCRSDWHGWMGHDPDIHLPHVPGHEMSGTVVALGSEVRRFRVDDRVTLPFVCACGRCDQCVTGNQQVCVQQSQPGFTHWGSYAEYVAIRHADENLVALPDSMDHVTAASLGCRFATAYRAVVYQGGVCEGQWQGKWVAVHGCGGVGLSAIMIASALGARVLAVDTNDAALAMAESAGAEQGIKAGVRSVSSILEITGGGAALSLDAFGGADACASSIACLRKRGRHVQVGLLAGDDSNPAVPMARVIADELEIVGSHGMQAYRYPEMLAQIEAGLFDPASLVQRRVNLDTAAEELGMLSPTAPSGITVINEFGQS